MYTSTSDGLLAPEPTVCSVKVPLDTSSVEPSLGSESAIRTVSRGPILDRLALYAVPLAVAANLMFAPPRTVVVTVPMHLALAPSLPTDMTGVADDDPWLDNGEYISPTAMEALASSLAAPFSGYY